MENRYKLNVANLSKVFITKKTHDLVVDEISLNVKENEFLVILGPGQCGKSVFLKMIAGFIKPTLGSISIDGQELTGTDRRISMVFQKLALLPWLTVCGNVEIGPKYSGMPKDERRHLAEHYIEMVGLKGFEDYYPRQLSGGMQQRVGIARAYANSPEVLLLDEPFGKLDAQTRYSMQDEILRIWDREKRTIIFVTNNIEEAIYLADRIIVFSRKPATVKAEFDLSSLPRPRDYVGEDFLEMRKRITEFMDLDLRKGDEND